jgi:isocitrate dehydrogenase kinase/phosphatase
MYPPDIGDKAVKTIDDVVFHFDRVTRLNDKTQFPDPVLENHHIFDSVLSVSDYILFFFARWQAASFYVDSHVVAKLQVTCRRKQLVNLTLFCAPSKKTHGIISRRRIIDCYAC